MTSIFVSYRRQDSGWAADRLVSSLRRAYGDTSIFHDVTSIPAGVDFRDEIRHAIESRSVILVVISTKWAEIMRERENETDYVRVEIETALQLKKLTIPILVDNIEMPDFSVLPQHIQGLQWHNAYPLRRDPDFENDVRRLIDTINSQIIETENYRNEHINYKEILPIEWVRIPAGAMITWFKAIPSTRTIGEYFIAKYPVTNREFSKFVLSGFYQNRNYWENRPGLIGSNDDFSFTNYCNNNNLGNPEQPVVGVNWDEAIAYCRWISRMLGEEITLPTSNQWLRAAQGDERYKYPWGDEWDPNKCNHSVSLHTYGPTPVKAYEKLGNVSPFGVVDMAGNVSEWCLNTEGTISTTNLASRSNFTRNDPEDLCNSIGPMWIGTRLSALGFRLAKNIVQTY